jgi:hypothetical protein
MAQCKNRKTSVTKQKNRKKNDKKKRPPHGSLSPSV